METIVIPAMVAGLVAAYPGYQMCHKAFFIAKRRWAIGPLCVLLPFVIAYLLFYVPFWLSAKKTVTHASMFTDFILFAICPAGVIALIAYVLDHISHRDSATRLAIGGGALIAIFLLPVAYFFYWNPMFDQFEIVLEAAAPSS